MKTWKILVLAANLANMMLMTAFVIIESINTPHQLLLYENIDWLIKSEAVGCVILSALTFIFFIQSMRDNGGN